nr:immunoglobulin heavy chain junction region [Macaca mulatta]MOX01001.1 immunoglobulin heavy chain junction region [Macaca mulatta]MOX01095.1 immunoglobulin heavy chain junction region [Macaca mulatta]MOX02311.1 immunoglobulin heavy chain junction region [Macaca mulatta]
CVSGGGIAADFDYW